MIPIGVHLIGYLLALIIGLILGLLGGGGSILTVPVFVYVLHFDPKLAIAMSLPVVGVTSLVGAIGHWRAGNVHLESALSFGVAAMAGAFVGARFSVFLDGRIQLLILGVTMLVSAALMLGDSFRPGATTSGVVARRASRGTLPGIGLAIGVLTGTIGIGGGFLIVPALVTVAGMSMHEAVGTSLLVITMNALAGFAGQSEIGKIPLTFVLLFTTAAIAGIVVGTRMVRHIETRTLKRAFAILVLGIAALVLWQNRALL